MKKVFSLVAFVAAALSFYSCDSSRTDPSVPVTTVTLEVTMADTKAYLDDQDYLHWQDGDKVWVNGDVYTVSVADDVTTIPGVKIASSYSAVYPAAMAGGYVDESHTDVVINFPAVQQYKVKDGRQVLDIPVTAYSTTNQLSFHCVASLFRITMNNDKKMDMKLQNISVAPQSTEEDVVESFSGQTSVSPASSTVAEASNVVSESGLDVVLSFDGVNEVIEDGSAKSYYVVVPSFSSSKLNVSFQAQGAEARLYTYHKMTASAKSLAANNIGDIPVQMSGSFEDYVRYFPQGNGSEENPYIITTVFQIDRFRELVNRSFAQSKRCFKLGKDINYGGSRFNPIGNIDHPFTGQFDGDGHRIYNIKLIRYEFSQDTYCRGFFGALNSAIVKNITIEADVLIDLWTSTNYVGIISAFACNTCFYNVTAKGTIRSYEAEYAHNVGGFVGVLQHANGSNNLFSGCTNQVTMDVWANEYNSAAGGFIGEACNVFTMQDCVNEADIIFRFEYYDHMAGAAVGGFVGSLNSLYTEPSYISVVFDRCRNNGNVTMDSYERAFAGGLIGKIVDYEDSDYNDFLLKVSNFVNKGTIKAISADSTEADAYAGGAVGFMYSDGPELSGKEYCPYFYNCLNMGTVTSTGNDSRTGGICGRVMDDDTKFILCVNVGSIEGNGDPHVGAISGGSDGLFDDGGEAYLCNWIDARLPCIFDDKDGDSGCICDTHFTAGWLNKRRTNFDYINKDFYTQWTNDQWSGVGDIHACSWVGDSLDGTLDLDF